MQITIDKLLPLLRRGYVAMNRDGTWYWHGAKPRKGIWRSDYWFCRSIRTSENLSIIFNIAPYKGKWKDSVMKCGHTATVKDGE